LIYSIYRCQKWKGIMKKSEKGSILLKPISKKAVTKWIDSIL
jgi:hypothetical protein